MVVHMVFHFHIRENRRLFMKIRHLFGWTKGIRIHMHVQLFATPCTAPLQAPLSMEFSRQQHWSGLPVPSPGDLPWRLSKLMCPASLHCEQILYHWSIRERSIEHCHMLKHMVIFLGIILLCISWNNIWIYWVKCIIKINFIYLLNF